MSRVIDDDADSLQSINSQSLDESKGSELLFYQVLTFYHLQWRTRINSHSPLWYFSLHRKLTNRRCLE